jgi:5'-3' exonuclease
VPKAGVAGPARLGPSEIVVLVHLVDGTYELFRYFFAVPPHRTKDKREVGGLRGVLGSVLDLIEGGATHLGVATDHIIESWRNERWPGYKTGAGVAPELLEQFWPLEEALVAMGVVVWAMVEFEADDALAAAARQAAADDRVERVMICTPDKDLGQCVGGKIVQFDRRQRKLLDVAGVVEKFGVPPESIPDWLALVGDSADGFPGLPGWGAKSAAAVLSRYRHIEDIPPLGARWEGPPVRGAQKLGAILDEQRDLALLFRELAILSDDCVQIDVDALRWTGPTPAFADVAASVDAPELGERASRLASSRH